MDPLKSLLLGAAFLIPVAMGAADLAPVALNSLPAAPHDIAQAAVMDQYGHWIGQVAGVQTDASGKPAAVSLRLKGRPGLVVLAAGAASYDESRNVLIASDSQPQITALAASR